jgi:Phage P22-like portal protein
MDDFDPRITEAKQFLKLANDADTNNRAEALEDLKFAAGDQWPVEIQNSRNLEARPCLTINKIDAYVRQVTNQQRQQRPRIKVHGMNSQSDAKVAEILTGICRHIEVNSDADHSYDNAFNYAVRCGFGYWRVKTDYVREDSFDQEIYIEPIHNPFTVYFDPNSTLPDGSDAERCLITEVVSKKVFEKMYPDAETGVGFTQKGTGDSNAEWVMKEDIRIAEYWYTERKADQLCLLSDGSKVFRSDLPSDKDLLARGLVVIDERPTLKKQVKMIKCTAMEVLEEGDWASKFIPIIPVYGEEFVVDNKRKKYGLVRMAKDSQRMYNFWKTALTESVALAPKAKWLLAEGQDEGHENEWAQANIKSMPVLRYKQKDIEGVPAPVPTRIQPEAPPAGIIQAADGINSDMQAVLGIFDANQLATGNISGKALNGQQQQIDLTNFHYYDNLTRSIKHTARIILDLIPKIYDQSRVMRIIGDDGKPDLVEINKRQQDEYGVDKILNDVTVGEYDVVMDTGPGYNSKRIEAVNSMMPLLSADPNLIGVAGDLIFRNMDFPGADVIADRLAASNPLAQIDEKSPVPPQVQMQLKQSQATIQQLQQQLQAMQLMLKNRADVEQLKQDAETKRVLIKETNRAHDIELRDQERHRDMILKTDTQAHDTVIKTQTQLEVERIKADLAVYLAQLDRISEKEAKAEAIERAI